MASPTPFIVVPALHDHTTSSSVADLVLASALPFLSPRDQQIMARGSREERNVVINQTIRIDPADTRSPGGALMFGKVVLSPLASIKKFEIVNAIAVRGRLTDSAVDESGELHSVVQGQDPALVLRDTFHSNLGNIEFEVHYGKRVHRVLAPPRMTGLQFKSLVIAELGLDGGFQNYFLTLDGTPFGSRTPLSAHPLIRNRQVLVLEDAGVHSKAIGHT
mmetsp:Transcript_26694/g.59732  ORF Transcript_26694/g.59732 Transcript_26694/m.59732 type:complete len:219 (+) Transcript_26694:25-681(+)